MPYPLPENSNAVGWMFLPLKRYAQFTGRSGRREFWWYSLFLALGMILIPLLGVAIATIAGEGSAGGWVGGLGTTVFFFANFIPGLALSARRFHDLGVSGHFLWLVYGGMLFFSFLAWIAYLVVMALPGKNMPNRYGPPVYDVDVGQIFA